MQTIVELKFGSHLYGTSTPASDLDLKAVYLPTGKDILLGRVKPVITNNTKSDNASKNGADDIDRETFSLQRYLGLVAEGQTVALDMLFAPADMVSHSDDLWREIQANRHRLLSCKSKSFLGYVKTQANKYGIKGSRMETARSFADLFDYLWRLHGTSAKLMQFEGDIMWMRESLEHVEIIDRTMPGDVIVKHLSVCGRQVPFTASIKVAMDVYAKLYQDYGERSRAAMNNEGIDWKALSHAVRVGRQAVELLSTGHVTFPRPEAAHLVAIKTGMLTYQPVAEEIEGLLVAVEDAAQKSSLPETADLVWIDQLVADVHREIVII